MMDKCRRRDRAMLRKGEGGVVRCTVLFPGVFGVGAEIGVGAGTNV